MRHRYISITIFVIILYLSLTACAQNSPAPTSIPLVISNSSSTPTPFQPIQNNLFLSPSVPQVWRTDISNLNAVQLGTSPSITGLSLSLLRPSSEELEYGSFQRVFAVVVPFPTVMDSISLDDIKGLWYGNATEGGVFSRLLVSPETAEMLEDFWATPPSEGVEILKKSELLDSAWKTDIAVAIIPFDELNSRWKVLRVNGISPLDKPMDVTNYPLVIEYHLIGPKADDLENGELATEILTILPATNRDESKMTILIMSGTTALARVTLKKIELNGYEYPVEFVKQWFTSADLRHISNEVSFSEECKYTSAYTMKFCSKDDQFRVLQNLGINVVELTGNHLNDYGTDALENTIDIIKNSEINYFGGGVNLEDAQKPLEISSNGNKIAFIGCNVVGPKSAWATESSAGSAPCDFEQYYAQISRLKKEGYVVVSTFQHTEVYLYMYDETYRTEFLNAAKAGADIVQGSQAHFPMGFGFEGNTLIHYGLGNFLFDQMDYPVEGTRREFIDRHIIYDGEYINTELLTALLTDWSKPVPMSKDARSQFLYEIFDASQMR